MGKATQPQNGFTALKTDDSQEQQGVESKLHEVRVVDPQLQLYAQCW